ncbi:hypothetical protein BDV95DRAFT_608043 [Massariosphaeria phaeospora]|uniref:Uncharacterized protein n=1 Tax=Massariosphaeria phaeospora TaxID=100035 RepID=A0A7C8M4F8_9PLEO|nr:hypothetical protein BDV95DRAFT_608043 [Massariosphaeria phaeospora]
MQPSFSTSSSSTTTPSALKAAHPLPADYADPSHPHYPPTDLEVQTRPSRNAPRKKALLLVAATIALVLCTLGASFAGGFFWAKGKAAHAHAHAPAEMTTVWHVVTATQTLRSTTRPVVLALPTVTVTPIVFAPPSVTSVTVEFEKPVAAVPTAVPPPPQPPPPPPPPPPAPPNPRCEERAYFPKFIQCSANCRPKQHQTGNCTFIRGAFRCVVCDKV